MVEDQHWTEKEAVVIAPEILDEVGPDERERLIERGKAYWSRTRGFVTIMGLAGHAVF